MSLSIPDGRLLSMTFSKIDAGPQFRQCPACGNQTSIKDPNCSYCGMVSVDAADPKKTASERRFLQELFNRSNPFTMIFIGINVGVFVLMSLAGGFAMTSVDPQVLLGFGAKQNNLIAEQHEYWRLITSIFIHIGVIHLLLNNYALWIIGQEIERIYGSARFVVLYLATGIVGSLGSYFFNPQATSAGASGAIFGLFGVMAAFAFRYRKEIPEFLSRDIKRRVIPVIFINLVFGFSVRIVDNAAHIGGLLAGIALAMVVPYMRPSERITPVIWRTLQVICLGVILISFVDAFRGYKGPRLSVSNLTSRPGSSVSGYVERMQEAEWYLNKSFEAFAMILQRNDNANQAALGTTIGFIQQSKGAIEAVPRIDSDADQYRKRLLELIGEQKSLLDKFDWMPESRKEFGERERALKERVDLFRSDYEKWLPGFLQRYGYELRDKH